MTHGSGKVMFVQNFTKPEGAMSHYKHLTLFEREKILLFLAKGYSVTEIAKELGRNKGTISRELRRNHSRNGYMPVDAQKLYSKRRKRSRRKKLLTDEGLYSLVKDKFLNQQWSPEQIAERLKLEDSDYQISYNTIYRAIYAGMFDTPEQRRSVGNRGMKRRLRHKGKPRHAKGCGTMRGKIEVSHDITERPKRAEKRARLGDWEADTVEGCKGSACLLTLVDRRSRYLLCRKLVKKTGDNVAAAMTSALENMPHKSITPDRGMEFCRHPQITEALHGVPFYFALPHHPWQRGTNENTSGLLREYFPKSFDLANVSPEHLQEIEDKINLRPRKCLGFKTPFEVFSHRVLHLT